MESSRLLGFAFAGADLLFEVDRQGVILFATGAINGFIDRKIDVGSPGAQLFEHSEGDRFAKSARGMTPGERIGPLPMILASGEKVSLSMCFLPQNDRISCTLVRPGPLSSLSKREAMDVETGLSDRDAFLAVVTQNAAGDGAVGLVNVPNLPEVCAKLSSADLLSLMAHIGESMKEMGATSAARLSETRFGVVAKDPQLAGSLAGCIQTAARERGVELLEIEDALVSLKGYGLTPEQDILALRHVVGRFAAGKLDIVPGGDLADVFDQLISETVARAQRFNATVSEGAFDLVFEPIVDLKTGAISHYEALTRFQPGKSPADIIAFAEELGLADAFDLAVALKIFTLLERDRGGDVPVAMNVSGHTIATSSSFAMLAGLLAKKRAMAKRLLIEITETAEMPDLAAANNAIQALRKMGYRVGIDDFGSGSASLTYLHAFAVDFVKIDGALVQRLGKSPREDALLKSLAVTCANLHIETIAEWIDSGDKLTRCREMGFCFGQGRHFGGSVKALPRSMALGPLAALHKIAF